MSGLLSKKQTFTSTLIPNTSIVKTQDIIEQCSWPQTGCTQSKDKKLQTKAKTVIVNKTRLLQRKKPYRCMYFDRCFSWVSQLKHLKHIHIQVRNPTNTSTVSGYWL